MPGGRPPIQDGMTALARRRKRLADEGRVIVQVDIPPDLAARLDHVLAGGEPRTDLARDAIAREIARRERAAARSP